MFVSDSGDNRGSEAFGCTMSLDLLISLIFKNRPLWDQKDKNHHNRYVLDKLWEEVAKEMKSTSKIVRSKWKNLRDKFRTEMLKKAKPRSGAGTEEYENLDDPDNHLDHTEPLSSWQYFDSLSFLKDQFIPRKNNGNLVVDQALSDPNEDLFKDSNINIFSPPSTAPSSPVSSVAGCSSTRKSKRSNDLSSNQEIASQLIEIEKKKLRLLSEEQNDEDIGFFQSLIPHIKKLTDEKKMLLMMDIQKMVYRYVYETSK
ncbi:uncharacterized protein LOC143362394 [Halictus rubicundus]|uniref:uncharacterized protein LOC143362394 n=1 Tax=Halictus rubicundus TaxID=77578 RepID=UPI0040367CF6